MWRYRVFNCNLINELLYSYCSVYILDCGVTNVSPNAKIVGGIVANPNSWPAQVLIIQSYSGDYTVNSNVVTVSSEWMCGGTLINGYTVLSAAHCIVDSFDKTINGTSYSFLIYHTNNPYNPTFQSMFKIYLGAHNISFVFNGASPPSPTVMYNVSDVIPVNHNF